MHEPESDAGPQVDDTLGDGIARNALRHGHAIAFWLDDVCGRAVTHRDHLRRIVQLAAGLHRAGMMGGDPFRGTASSTWNLPRAVALRYGDPAPGLAYGAA
jgi:hypothetical protein